VHDLAVQMAIDDVAETLGDKQALAEGADILIDQRKRHGLENTLVAAEILLDLRATHVVSRKQAKENGVARVDPGERFAVPYRRRIIPPLLYLVEDYVMHLKTGTL
jgi:hypothetical protein